MTAPVDPIALICSVQLETEPALRHLRSRRPLDHATVGGWEGSIGDRRIFVISGGMGKVNASRSLTAFLEKHEVAGVVGFGVGGAYKGSGLGIGDIAVATVEHYGDEGVETPSGWMSCEGIGIPLLKLGTRKIFNQMPVDQAALESLRAAAAAENRLVRSGPFVTVSTCSGTEARGSVLERRYAAICETMEGAAYAHVAALYRVPFLEVRGISNMVENREPSGWRLTEAAVAAADLLPLVVRAWPHSSSPEAAEPA